MYLFSRKKSRGADDRRSTPCNSPRGKGPKKLCKLTHRLVPQKYSKVKRKSKIWNIWENLCLTSDSKGKSRTRRRDGSSDTFEDLRSNRKVRFNDDPEIISIPNRPLCQRLFKSCFHRCNHYSCFICYILCYPCYEFSRTLCSCLCNNEATLGVVNTEPTTQPQEQSSQPDKESSPGVSSGSDLRPKKG